MKNTKKGNLASKALLMGTALVSLNALTAAEAKAATGTGAMSASILTPIVVSGTQVLIFGDATITGAGTITIDAASPVNQTSSGTVTTVNTSLTPQPGVLQIQGGTGVAIDLSMAATSYNVAHTVTPTIVMVVDGFNIGTAAAGSVVVATLAASPETRLLGATLNIGAAQAPGLYTGNYTVNANYQP